MQVGVQVPHERMSRTGRDVGIVLNVVLVQLDGLDVMYTSWCKDTAPLNWPYLSLASFERYHQIWLVIIRLGLIIRRRA